MSDNRRRLWIGLGTALVVLVLFLRELGAFDFTLHFSSSEHNNVQSGKRPSVPSSRALEVDLVVGGETQHQSVMRGTAGAPLHVRAEVTRFDLQGAYWSPLWKTGRCSYEVKFTSKDVSASGVVAGTIDRRTFGLCPARGFREALLDEVRQHAMFALTQ
jgi:hypothetical protein